ncbi:MAG: DUF1007 family protein [Pseudomonadota bacterium]
MKKILSGCFLTLALSGIGLSPVEAHPHVFVEANIEVVRDDKGRFVELRHVWRFDELFSATTVLDFDADGDGVLGPDELALLSSNVKESISEFDFFTALRVAGKAVEFYEPEELKSYYENDQLIMLMAIEVAEPYDFSGGPLRVSVSDTSFYVAFDYDVKNISVEGPSDTCASSVVHPDFDKLYASDSLSLTEAFFDDPTNTQNLGDEFYSWATIDCK